MKLSKLVYLTVKNVVYLDDVSFTYNEFLKDTFNDSADYGVYIHNVFLPLNEAIARLNDLNCIKYKILLVDKSALTIQDVYNSYYDLPDNIKVQDIISVEQRINNKYRSVNFRYFPQITDENGGKIKNRICINDFITDSIVIEYKEDIKHFDEDSYAYSFDINDTTYNSLREEKDEELSNYGITDNMCNYIIEYASAKLLEDINPELSHSHIARAEQYFSGLRTVNSNFAQKVVKDVYGI